MTTPPLLDDCHIIRECGSQNKLIDQTAVKIVTAQCQQLNPLILLHPEIATSPEFINFIGHLHAVSLKIQKRRSGLNPLYANKITKHLRELSLEAEELMAPCFIAVDNERIQALHRMDDMVQAA